MYCAQKCFQTEAQNGKTSLFIGFFIGLAKCASARDEYLDESHGAVEVIDVGVHVRARGFEALTRELVLHEALKLRVVLEVPHARFGRVPCHPCAEAFVGEARLGATQGGARGGLSRPHGEEEGTVDLARTNVELLDSLVDLSTFSDENKLRRTIFFPIFFFFFKGLK